MPERARLSTAIFLIVLALQGVVRTDAVAQGPPAPGAPAPQAAAPDAGVPEGVSPPPVTGTSSDVPRLPNTYPPDPLPFQRGNPTTPGAIWYVSLWKMLLVIGAFLGWVSLAKWVSNDARGLKVRPSFWNTLVYLCGLAALLLFLTLPSFGAGFFMAIIGLAAPAGAYINERNQAVPESGKVLTPRHIKRVTQRYLARFGIRFGGGEGDEDVIGPNITFIGKTRTGKVDSSTSRQVENSKGYMAAKELVYDAILRRATDIHLEPKENELSVRLRIDGVMYPTEPFDRAVGDAIVNITKVLSAMDITERRRSQDGGFGAHMDGREIDFRVASQGTREGEKLVIRILDQANSVSSVAQLGMRKKLMDQIKDVVHEPHGMFICCGPTGAGKSTTLYACLNEIDSFQRNIITIEDPIEYKMENVTQIEINTKADQTFAGSLRSVLRQDPDVVMVGEIRDSETARIACQAANTGHMVFSTVHANDTITAVLRLIDLEVDPTILSSSISAILGQRLARRLCPDCKESYKPNPEFIKKAGLPVNKIESFCRPPKEPAHCPTCGDLGYKGRVGVFEFLGINDRIQDLIRDSAAVSAIRAEARKDGMLTMKEEGLRLVINGITSMDELQRVVRK
ncbi:MAG: GspE/PulE family protein [Planctomycetaceae bacterium]